MPDVVPDQPRSRRHRTFGSILGGGLTALLPVLACFLGGGTLKWEEGIVIAFLGLLLLLRPPRRSLGISLNCLFVIFIALGSLAFLPARWFFFPAWRAALINDFATTLPTTVSAQPWISGTCLVSLIAGAAWLYYVATSEAELRSVRSQLRLFVSGIVTLALLSIVVYLAHLSMPFWSNQRNFGPFPNRNQTADLFGITAIVLLACGQDDLRHGRNRWILWLIGLGILITAIILNLSRAGIAIVVGGSVLWIAVVALRQRSSARIALGFSFVLLLLTAILLLGGQTLERFNFHQPGGTGLTSDFRWKIFHDAFDMIRASPWCGVGLGNFESIFATFRRESLTQTRALHPESDWIWLWAELGLPALLITILGAILLIRHVLPLQEGTNQRFRLAALFGAIIFAIHGIVDVSAHRVGTAYAALFLFGMALHRPQTFKRSVTISILFRLVGLGLIVSGVGWAMAAKKNQLLPGSVGVSSVKQLSPVSMRGRDYNEAIELSSRGLEWAPLDWQLYFTRALAEIGARKPDHALDDFRRARFLEPNSFEVPMAEGSAWLVVEPINAATAWREALRRTTTGAQRLEVYGNMFSKAAVENPEVGHILQDVGVAQHDLVLAYLSRVTGPRFNDELKRFLKNDPDLHTLTDPEKLALFSLWSERGDLDELARKVQQYPAWMPYAWFGVAKRSAKSADFKSAYELTQKFGDAVAMPRLNENASLEQLQNRYFANPDNYATGYALYREQMQRGRVDDALLTARHFSERPNAPAYFHFLEARAWAGKQNWERAWKAWLAYQEASARK